MAAEIGFFIGAFLISYIIYKIVNFIAKQIGKPNCSPYTIAIITLFITTSMYAAGKYKGGEFDYSSAFFAYILPVGLITIIESIKKEKNTKNKQNEPVAVPEVQADISDKSNFDQINHSTTPKEQAPDNTLNELRKDFEQALRHDQSNSFNKPIESVPENNPKPTDITLISDAKIAKLERLFELKSKGALTEEEFNKQKEILLKNNS